MKILLFTLFVLLISCSQKENKLEVKSQTVRLRYIAWACACANWVNTDDTTEYKNQDSLADHCVFVEPADSTVALPDTLGYSGDIIEFTGQFYKNKGYPKGYVKMEEPLDSAKVFRYMGYKIIHSHYKDFMNNLKSRRA
jgi:hypothetical protein